MSRSEFRKLSRAYLDQARLRLDSAARVMRQGKYAYCVRLSAEGVELSTKALLRSRGVEYPKFHDTSPALLALKDGLPEKEVSFLAKASEELSRKRALAMYGDEARGLGPDEIFGREDAREAYQTATESLRICQRLASKRR